ncbi:MAG: hypothetical protein NXI27_11940 [Alphaproteobacteria bacterium]|nr:hypothetical protein [Alphaproteobacteria bacterium]
MKLWPQFTISLRAVFFYLIFVGIGQAACPPSDISTPHSDFDPIYGWNNDLIIHEFALSNVGISSDRCPLNGIFNHDGKNPIIRKPNHLVYFWFRLQGNIKLFLDEYYGIHDEARSAKITSKIFYADDGVEHKIRFSTYIGSSDALSEISANIARSNPERQKIRLAGADRFNTVAFFDWRIWFYSKRVLAKPIIIQLLSNNKPISCLAASTGACRCINRPEPVCGIYINLRPEEQR